MVKFMPYLVNHMLKIQQLVRMVTSGQFSRAAMGGLLVAGTLLTGCWLASCGGYRQSGKKIFHYNESSGISSLDPAFAKSQAIMWAVHQLYNTLVEVDSNMNLVPSVAKGWDISADNLVLTFHLRSDVHFVDDACFAGGKGRRVVAQDVAYSFGRIIHKQVASPGAWIFNGRVDSVRPFVAVDDTTFQLRLQRPFQPILGILTMPYCSIVPQEAVDKYGADFRRHPVGTGPFAMVAWEEGQALVMKKNDRYFETDASGQRLPYLDGLRISFFDSKATEFLEFQQKRLDFINDIDASFKDELLTKTGQLKKNWQGKVRLHKHPYLNIEYLGILIDSTNELMKNSPLRLRKIRQAINYGFDRRKMMLYLRNSIGTAAESGFVPMGLPSFDSAAVKGYAYNPDKARQLLREAGFPDGQGLPSIQLLTVPIYADLGSYIANELNRLGIRVQVEAMQKSLLMDRAAKSQAPFFRGSWIADYPDAENYLSVFYGQNPAPPNYTRYRNPAFDALYEKALLEKNDSLRYGLYRQMDRLVMDDAPVVPLWYDMVIHLVHNHVEGFRPNSLNLLELRRTRIM
jgi:oligopeptide transport system substrate-binding protein